MQNALHLVSETRRVRNQVPTITVNNNDDEDTEEVDEENEQKKVLQHEEINIRLARILINAGCNMNHRDFQLHETPIYKAILQNDFKLVKLLIVEGIDYNSRNVFGNDALSRSIQLGRFKIARLLVDVDAPIRKATCFYKMPRNDEINKQLFFNQQRNLINENDYEQGREDYGNRENMLMLSLENYEMFLKYLKTYTHDKPRSLIDLARLKVRRLMRKPISVHLSELKMPNRINNFILLKDLQD